MFRRIMQTIRTVCSNSDCLQCGNELKFNLPSVRTRLGTLNCGVVILSLKMGTLTELKKDKL